MDISDTLAPNSDQLDAVDLLGGPQTFTIAKVSKGNDEQPVNIQLAEFPRVWRPGKSMRRVLAALWTADASTWTGRRVTLYCDEKVRFGSDVVGGTRIAAMSDIGDKPRSVPLLVSRGKSATFVVQPLADVAPPQPVTTATLADLTDILTRKGVPEAAWLSGANQITGGSAPSLDALTEDQAQTVLAALAQRPDVEGS
jgi:hypothetical protein